MPDIPLHPLYVGVQIGKEDVRQDMVDCLVSITEGKRQGGVLRFVLLSTPAQAVKERNRRKDKFGYDVLTRVGLETFRTEIYRVTRQNNTEEPRHGFLESSLEDITALMALADFVIADHAMNAP